MQNSNLVNCLIVSAVIILTVHFFMKPKNRYVEEVVTVYKQVEPMANANTNTKSPAKCHNPFKANAAASEAYVTKLLGAPNLGATVGSTKKCKTPVKSRKDFHKDFFNFRDTTNKVSTHKFDAVDKIQQLYLQGNLGEAHGTQGKRIKDIFDEAVAGPNLYTKPCVRLPDFDNVNFDGYKAEPGVHGMSLTAPNWVYPNESVNNGGEIDIGLVASDPAGGNSMPVSMGKPMAYDSLMKI